MSYRYIRVDFADGVATVTFLQGSVTEYREVEVFLQELHSLVMVKENLVVVNLSGVTFLNEEVIGGLFSLHKSFENSGDRLVLHNASGYVLEKIKDMKFDELFNIE